MLKSVQNLSFMFYSGGPISAAEWLMKERLSVHPHYMSKTSASTGSTHKQWKDIFTDAFGDRFISEKEAQALWNLSDVEVSDLNSDGKRKVEQWMTMPFAQIELRILQTFVAHHEFVRNINWKNQSEQYAAHKRRFESLVFTGNPQPSGVGVVPECQVC